MADTVAVVVNAITAGIKWVRQKYREFKVWVAEGLIKALEKGWTAALTIAGLVTASIVVGYVYEIMMRNAIVVAVKTFLTNLATSVKSIAAIMQVDLIITLVNLSVLLNRKLYEKLAPLYEELGSLAEELELDLSYFNVFLEVDRSILFATYQFTNAGFLKADAEYAEGLSTWLSKLRGRLAEYATDPQKIFTDIQGEIAAQRIKDANAETARIWAAINFAGNWVRGKGAVLLDLVDDLDRKVGKLPQEIQDAIAPWWDELKEKVDAFERDTWGPFWERYKSFEELVDEQFLAYGMDIAELKRRIDDPIDWLRSLMALPEDEKATLSDTLNDFLRLPRESTEDETRAEAVPALLAALDAIEHDAAISPEVVEPITGLPLGELVGDPVDTSSSGPALTDEPEES